MRAARVYLARLSDAYGTPFLGLLCSVYLCLKGPAYTMIMSAQLPYFKSIGITGQRFQSFTIVASTPWAMKAVIGIVSDSLPIMGTLIDQLSTVWPLVSQHVLTLRSLFRSRYNH